MLPGEMRRLAEPKLYTAVRGSCCIVVDGTSYEIAPGDALWLPVGVACAVTQSDESVVVPVPGRISGPRVVARVVDANAQLPLLLEAYSRALGHLEDGVPQGIEVRLSGSEPMAPPPAPRSPDLHDLATLLSDDPDLELSAAVDAAVTGWGLRSVQRRFRAETGCSLTAWVRHSRVHTAAELLSAGRELGWVANRVGFRSVPGFIRAFRAVTGSIPGEWRKSATLTGIPTARIIPSDAPREYHTWERVNGAHVAV